MNLERPIFIIGCGRSGTTLLLNLLARHPDLAWFSNYANKNPEKPQSMALSRILSMPVLGPKIADRFPGLYHSPESINIYKFCGIHELHLKKQAPLTEDDVTVETSYCFRNMVAQCLRYSGKNMFINKNVSNSMRVRFLNTIFQKPIFIHIIRDGRAVVNSLIHVNWWPDVHLWWAGFTPKDWQSEGKAPVELCAQHWRNNVSAVLEAVPHLGTDQYIEVYYEHLCEDPVAEIKRLVKFCGLRWTNSFEEYLRNKKIDNNNFKWGEQLSRSDQDILQSNLSEFLHNLGY